MNKKEALILGKAKYTPEKPCRNGHLERYTLKGECVKCKKNNSIKQNACIILTGTVRNTRKLIITKNDYINNR